MRGYEESEKIAKELMKRTITNFPLEVIKRNSVNEMIVFLDYDLGVGFRLHDRLEGTKKIISMGEAISMINQHRLPKYYVLQTE